MGIRIMQLQYEVNKNEATIVDGYEMWLSPSRLYQNKFGLDSYAIIESTFTPGEKKLVISFHSYVVTELGDGFKKITLGISEYTKVEKEDKIFLMIGIGADSIKSDHAEKIAGRYYYEGIFILKPNDRISVTRGELTEEFLAIQFDKQMYLIKIRN